MRVLGVSETLRQATLDLAMSVSLSVSPSFRPHETIRLLPEGLLWNLLFEDSSKIGGNNSSFIRIWQEWRIIYTKTYVHFLYSLAELFLKWEVLQGNVVEKIKTRVLCGITFPFENPAICEIMLKNIAELDRPLMTIWRMRIECWTSKATNSHSMYVTLIALRRDRWLRECTSILGPIFFLYIF